MDSSAWIKPSLFRQRNFLGPAVVTVFLLWFLWAQLKPLKSKCRSVFLLLWCSYLCIGVYIFKKASGHYILVLAASRGLDLKRKHEAKC